MKKIFHLPASIAVFLIFFGVSVLEAFRTRNWINVMFWVFIAGMFLIADGLAVRKMKKEVE